MTSKQSRAQSPKSIVYSLKSSVSGLLFRLSTFAFWRFKRSAVCGLRSDSRGFSLIELMAVMLVMFIMMGLSTVAMRGVVRGAGLRGAITTTRGAFIKARQYAMMNGRPTAVLLTQESGQPGRMRTIASYGRVARVLPENVIVTENGLPWKSGEISGAAVFTFDGDEGSFGTNEDIKDSDTNFIINGIESTEGDEIALEVGTIHELSTGLAFDGPALQIFIFNPDGSSSGGDIHASEIKGDGGFRVEIGDLTGKITVTMDE